MASKKLFHKAPDSVEIGCYVIEAQSLTIYDSSTRKERVVRSGQCQLHLFLKGDTSKYLDGIEVILDCLPSKAKHIMLVNILNFSVDTKGSRSKSDIFKIEQVLFRGMILLYKDNSRSRRLSTITDDFVMDHVTGTLAISYFADRFKLQIDTATGLGAAVVTPW